MGRVRGGGATGVRRERAERSGRGARRRRRLVVSPLSDPAEGRLARSLATAGRRSRARAGGQAAPLPAGGLVGRSARSLRSAPHQLSSPPSLPECLPPPRRSASPSSARACRPSPSSSSRLPPSSPSFAHPDPRPCPWPARPPRRVFHAPFLFALPDLFRLHTVVERRATPTESVARTKFGPSAGGERLKVVTTLEEALADGEVELVLVTTFPETHAAMAKVRSPRRRIRRRRL